MKAGRPPILVEINGQSRTLREISRATDVPYGVLWQRYHRGDRGDALVRPARRNKRPARDGRGVPEGLL